MTAEEFLNQHHTISHFYSDKEEKMICYSEDVQKAMIDFAKHHVQEALKACSEKASMKVEYPDEYSESNEYNQKYINVDDVNRGGEYASITIEQNSILEAYLLTQIK